MKAIFSIWIGIILLESAFDTSAQRINVGITFQYHFLKQVKVDAESVMGTHSYSVYQVRDNRWKFFSAGQSIVIGTVLQVSYKKLYAVVEPSFDLNTYNYILYYPVTAQKDERLNFHTLFFQADIPFYLGFQFGATKLIRYSVFGGVVVVLPYMLEYSLQSRQAENPQEYYFNSADMDQILYNRSKYGNALGGLSLHFASLGKIDVRYQYRLGSPGDKHRAAFHSLGFGLTYYLPLHLKKREIYYEDQ